MEKSVTNHSRARQLVTVCGKYAWYVLRRLIKGTLRRPAPGLRERRQFLCRYLLHLIGIRPIRAIACVRYTGREGAGSQAHLIMDAINFARASGIDYLHTPFARMGHGDRPMPELLAAWEEFMNLGAGELRCEPGNDEVVNYCYTWIDLEQCFGWCGRRKELTRRFRDMIPDLRRKFYSNKAPGKSEQLSVAVHLRRGDVGHVSAYFTPNDEILKTITAVRSVLSDRSLDYRLHILLRRRFSGVC